MTRSVSQQFGLDSLQAARRNVRNSIWSGLLVHYDDKYNVEWDRVQNPQGNVDILKRYMAFGGPGFDLFQISLPLLGK